MNETERLAGFHFQVTFNFDYSFPLLVWVMFAKVFLMTKSQMALFTSGHFEVFVVISWESIIE